MLYIDGLFMFLSYRLKINEWLWLNDYLAFVEILCKNICIVFICFDSIAQWLYVLFQPSAKLKLLIPISGLVKFISNRSLFGKKSEFLSKAVFVVTLILPFTTLGIFWVITNWFRFQGWRCKSTLRGTKKIITDQEKYFCRQTEIFVSEEGCTFSLAILV